MAGVKSRTASGPVGRSFAQPSTPRSDYPLDRAKGFELAWMQVSELFEVARRMSGASFVYVIGEQDDGPVKIGVAKNPLQRLRQMQTGNPRRLRIEYVLVGDAELEKLLHEYWGRFAIPSAAKRGKPDSAPGTEWFESEIRVELFPIMATATARQVEYLTDASGGIPVQDLEKIVRLAHAEHGFVAQGREEVRFLAHGGGYIYGNRRSRI